MPARDLAQDRDLRETRSDVVVQIRGDAGPDALQRERLSQPVSVCRPDRQGNQDRRRAEGPPALIPGRQDCKGHESRRCAGQSPRVYGPHFKAILARRDIGVGDARRVHQRTPAGRP